MKELRKHLGNVHGDAAVAERKLIEAGEKAHRQQLKRLNRIDTEVMLTGNFKKTQLVTGITVSEPTPRKSDITWATPRKKRR